VSDQQDWRLEASGVQDAASLFGRLRGRGVEHDLEAAVSPDVVLTHDGQSVFAYAASEESLRAARREIEAVLERDRAQAAIRVSHWDHELDDWRQIDPPISGQPGPAGSVPDTQTFVCSSGKLVREVLEQSMRQLADELGLECTVVEHPHLLTTQVAFTVSGPHRKVEEFKQGLSAEGRATIRADSAALNPL
jgi:hypothetical protein